MNLILNKTKEELEHIFKVSCVGERWGKEGDDTIYKAGDRYPVITNERPVTIQSFLWGFPLYLDDSQTILKPITQVGVEGVFDKPMFECITTKRCLVPVQQGEHSELKYGAGVWDVFTNKEGNPTKYFTVLTIQSVGSNHRVPFLLDGGLHKQWLSEENRSVDQLMTLVK